MAFFPCKYAFSNQNMTFYINKRRRKTPYMAFSMQIRLFRCLSEGVGCRRYVLNFKHFWIWSEGGGSEFFHNFWNSKYSELSEGGGGSSLIGNFSQIFPFFLVTPPLNIFPRNGSKKVEYLKSRMNDNPPSNKLLNLQVGQAGFWENIEDFPEGTTL